MKHITNGAAAGNISALTDLGAKRGSFTEQDLAQLQLLGNQVSPPRQHELVEDFLLRISEQPEFRRNVQSDDQHDRLALGVQSWLGEFLSGKRPHSYRDHRAQLGRLHARQGIDGEMLAQGIATWKQILVEELGAAELAVERREQLSGLIERALDAEFLLMAPDQKDHIGSAQRIAVLMHDLRGPLAVASTSLFQMERQYHQTQEPDEAMVRRLERIRGSLEELDRRITSGLDLFSKEGADGNLLSLNRILDQAIEDLDAEAIGTPEPAGMGIEVQRDYACADFTPALNAQLLRGAVRNILVNAAQAMEGRGRIRVSTKAQDQDRVRVTVADQGPGLPDGGAERIFEPGYTSRREGAGMGLAIVNRIMATCGGTAEAENGDAGAIFHLTFPITTDNADEEMIEGRGARPQAGDAAVGRPAVPPGSSASELQRSHGGGLSFSMLCTVLGIMLCCIGDAILTGALIQEGKAVEGNPIMQWALDIGAGYFLTIKYSITGAGMIFLLAMRRRPLFRWRISSADLLPLIQLLYVILLLYEGFLVAGWPGKA